MATYQINRSACFGPDSPGFDDLEIRCTWNGDYLDRANFRISLEVRCAPNTQLQLLNMRDPDVQFHDAFLERLPQSEHHTDDQEEEAPQSPLFGFSSLAGDGDNDDGAGSLPHVENDSVGVGISDFASISEDDELFADSEVPGAELTESERGLASPVCSVGSGSYAGLPESESSSMSRKRSATDADLTDSDIEAGPSEVLQEITNRNSRPAKSRAAGEPTTERTISDPTTPRQISCPTSPNRPKSMRTSGLAISNENRPTSPSKSSGAGATNTERLRLPGLSIFNENHSQKPSLIPQLRSPKHPDSSPSTSSVGTVVELQCVESDISGIHAETADSTKTQSNTTRVRFQLPSHTTPTSTAQTQDSDSKPLGVVPTRGLKTIFERPVEFEASTRDIFYESQNLEDSSGDQEHDVEESEVSLRPEMNLVDGLIILENSEKVQPATYKVTFTASIHIPWPNEKGWSDLTIPGLPRTGNGRSGFFLFLMPVNHGLELRTTNVKRAKIVENCFIAEFVNAGNLVIPLRICDRDFCGEVTDFTVYQEVVAHSAVRLAASTDRSKFEIRYHAMCSIKLHNRCFWADRCCIFLYLDGGPGGVFRCDLSPQKGGLKKIHIMADEYAEIGVSCVQVTCSPKDLEKLCVTWVTSGSGKQAACWLPRIYSTPSRSLARIRDSLRYALLDVVNEVTSFTSASQASDSECAYDSEPTQGDPSKLGPKETKDDPVHVSRSRAVSTWANSLRMVRLLILFCIQNPNYFIKQGLVAVLCLAFLGLGFIMSVRSGHHCPVQTSPLPVQAQSEVLDQANQILLAHYPGKLFEDSQEGVEGQGTTTSSMSILSVLNRYRAADVDGEAEPKMSLENERDHVKQDVEVGADVNADSSSLRDNIDYWLGWSGPLEIE